MIFEPKIRNQFRSIGGVTLMYDELFNKVQKEFLEYISLGESVEKAENILTNFFENAEGTLYDIAICYLALAYGEWKSGYITDKIKQKALEVLDNKIALDPWLDACSISENEKISEIDYVFKDGSEWLENIFYKGICYDVDNSSSNKNELVKDFAELVTGNYIPYLDIKKSMHSENITQILMLDKSPQKKYEMRKRELEKFREIILSPKLSVKKYVKPKFPFSCDYFNSGDIAVFKIPNGEFEGYYFAFEFFAKKENRYFIARNDIGVWYDLYGSFFDYFSTIPPTIDILKERGLKILEINKFEGKLYYKFSNQFYYDEKILNNHFVNKFFDENHYLLVEGKESRLKNINACAGSFELGNISHLKKTFIEEPYFYDYDNSDV